MIIRSNDDIDSLVQESRNSIANALELRLSCTNPSICCGDLTDQKWWDSLLTQSYIERCDVNNIIDFLIHLSLRFTS